MTRVAFMDSTKIVAWWGAILSTVGIIVSILGLRWQRKIHQENTAERILVHLDAVMTETSYPAPGEVRMEVVNIGLRPLFIKRADMRMRGHPGHTFTFYEHDPAKINEPMKSLEPSEAITYSLSWDFKWWEEAVRTLVVNPQMAHIAWLKAPNLGMEDIEVQVQTTKKTFSFQHQSVTVSPIVVVTNLSQDTKSTSKQASPDH